MKKLFAWVVLLAVAVFGWLTFSLFTPSTPSQQLIMLKPGTGTRQIAAKLEQAGVIRSANAFLLYHYFRGRRSLKAGEYDFTHPGNTLAVYEKIARGEISARGVVIPEGFNMFDVADALDQAGICKREDFLKYVRTDVSLISDIAPE